MMEKMMNKLYILFFYFFISLFLLKTAKTYNFIVYFIAFIFCVKVIAILAKKIILEIYFEFNFDLNDYQYLFIYRFFKKKHYINIINVVMLIVCYYYSFFIFMYYFFNYLNLDRRFDNVIRGFYDFEDEKIILTFQGKAKIKKYINDIVFENQVSNSNLVYLEDFYFCDEIHNKMFINGYI